jgi:ferredoxin
VSAENGAGDVDGRLLDEWRTAAYNCFSSGHKFCREVCPVLQVTHDETHSPTAFHANVVAMDKGLLTIEDVAEDYVNCTQCGACELRCPNTIFAGDFYRFRTRTVDLVKAMRSLAVEHGIHQPGWQRWNLATDENKNEPVIEGVSQERVADWAAELGLTDGMHQALGYSREAIQYAADHVRVGAERAGRDWQTLDIGAWGVACVSEEREAARGRRGADPKGRRPDRNEPRDPRPLRPDPRRSLAGAQRRLRRGPAHEGPAKADP